MGFIRELLSFKSTKNKQEEQERRETEGYTAWHPEYGYVYYPSIREKYDGSTINNTNWPEHGTGDAWDYT